MELCSSFSSKCEVKFIGNAALNVNVKLTSHIKGELG